MSNKTTAERRPDTLEERRSRRLRSAISKEQRRGLRLAIGVRLCISVIIAAWLIVSQRDVSVIYYLGDVALFAAIGLGQLVLLQTGRARTWHKYAFAVADALLVTSALILPNPLAGPGPPPAIALRGDWFLFLFLVLVPTVLSLSPFYVVWTGLVCAAAWCAGVLWVLSLPETKAMLTIGSFKGLPLKERIAAYMDPNFFDVIAWYQQIVIFLIVAGMLAVAVWRSQGLVRRQAIAERARGNLARYFSPNVVDALAELDSPLRIGRQQNVAVLFADIVGFTALAERSTPEATIALLREHYDRLANLLFAHGGTLDKYIGDGLMATFGTPDSGPDDATRSLRCAKAMLDSLHDWNAERAQRGEEAVRLGIGIDYGPVILGNIGGERRLEITVIGDTVNVANRLEGLTRIHGVELVVSNDLVEQVRRESGPDAPELAGLVEGPVVPLRGRDGLVAIWTLGRGVIRRRVAGA